MKVTVIGLGKIGLPLALQYAKKGCDVYGVDINEKVVEMTNKGESYLKSEPETQAYLEDAISKKKLKATTKFDVIAESDVVVAIVPLVTAEDYSVDDSIIRSVAQKIGANLRKERKTTVIFETTLPIGTTRKVIMPILEKASHLKAGEDFYIAYSPERVYSGQIFKDLQEYPKIVGGLNDKSLKQAKTFYAKVLDTEIIETSSLETAEAIKLFEMVYRNVNIALANEFAKLAENTGIDVMEAIRGANTISKYYHIHRPGCGVGGHCAPVYPHFLIHAGKAAGVDLPLVKKATEVNDDMPRHSVELVESEIGDLKGKRVLILGLSYRGNVKETFKSPSIDLIREFKAKKARVFVYDPYYSDAEIEKYGATPAKEIIGSYDVIFIAAVHDQFKKLDFAKYKSQGAQLFFDGTNSFDKKMIEQAGLEYKGVGH